MQESDAELLLRAVANAAESLAEIQAAFLFGAQASGRARTDSDIDVAVLLDVASTRVDARTRLRRVIEALAPTSRPIVSTSSFSTTRHRRWHFKY